MKKIDQAHLKALEEEKRKEVDELVQEMSNLKRKESIALQEIEKLMKEMQNEDVEEKWVSRMNMLPTYSFDY